MRYWSPIGVFAIHCHDMQHIDENQQPSEFFAYPKEEFLIGVIDITSKILKNQ